MHPGPPRPRHPNRSCDCRRARPAQRRPTIKTLDDEIDAFDTQLNTLIAIAAPSTLTQLGVGPCHAATLLIAAGENIDRFTSEAAFAHLCATAPIPASSGRTSRHRLNYAGNRQANRAVHMIVVVRLRYCERTQVYTQRRLAEGRTKKAVIRCLKRFVARELYRTLRADLATLRNRLDTV